MRRLLAAAVLATSLVACDLDEAELYRAGAAQITADVGELRVLAYEDDPAVDDWVDVVSPDPTVMDEGDRFREDDSRLAAADEPAEIRRLLTAVARGRTLLVQVDCGACPVADDAGILVWDLLVGDAERDVSAETAIARPDERFDVDAGDFVTVVHEAEPTDADVIGEGGGAVRLIARHEPSDGADLYVDVYLATTPGALTLAYGNVTYPIRVR